ncbi:MAG: adenylate/guanylate cyclase domain-containing protein [Thermoleophilia bacterium]|nr:adenylate/guanylate cyclase domain-containing protein [Thermoleophilia bacterium]
MPAETRYAKSGDLNIAYQVVGEGPLDLVYVSGWVSNVELMWEEPLYARFLNRLGSFSRLIVFDKRGTGLSDRVPTGELPTLEERMDDVRAVLDVVGSERAAVFGNSEGGNLSLLFAATYPQRTVALVTHAIFAKRLWSPDYPWAPTPEARAQEIEEVERNWATLDPVELAPSADEAFRRRLAAYFRRSASPGAAVALLRMNTRIDTRSVLPTIRVPTLVLHRTHDRDVKVEEGRWIATQIPGARFVELPGEDHVPWVGNQEEILAEIEEFLTGVRPVPEPDRVLATVLFTDVVGSTERAREVGDVAWGNLLDRHHALVRRELERFRGREIDTAGDGFLATFDGPARAIRCARAIADAVREVGLEVRAGVHTGECELADGSVRGIAVHTGARVAGHAGPSEVLVSGTVKDLVAGSGIEFADLGARELKGVGTSRLYSVLRA